MKLTMGEKIRILLKRKDVTILELSRRIGTSNQNRGMRIGYKLCNT